MKSFMIFFIASFQLLALPAVSREHGLRTLRQREKGQDQAQDQDIQVTESRNLTLSNDFSAIDFDLVRRNTGSSCSDNQRMVKIELLTDDFGYETSWLFRDPNTKERLAESRDTAYGNGEYVLEEFCVDTGFYDFIIKDKFNDGMSGGYYKISVRNPDGSWRQAVQGREFTSSMKHTIDVGKTESTMTDRDLWYLEAHNWRRNEYHVNRYNKEYIPLRWSQGLKDSAMEYAIKLLDTCTTTNSPKHDPNNPYGENMARNKGSGSWGQLYHPEQIVGRFIDREDGLPWSQNGHLTNALWRATRYVGCAEAEKTYYVTNKNGKQRENTCRTQVCRYAKPGNCDMGRYRNADNTIDWETPMLQDDSPCEPICPPEGCYE
mmetsp:Transcript_13630/g.29273  ORF Transcript_13630/g.29273 Transcript_13630/m.29273 type:complete len:376 (-) Transcript_13630:192-1319(-)